MRNERFEELDRGASPCVRAWSMPLRFRRVCTRFRRSLNPEGWIALGFALAPLMASD